MLEEGHGATWDPVWEEIFKRRGWGKYPPEHIVRFIALSFAQATDRGAVCLLEIGCGPGANVWFMSREGFQVSGIDGSSTAIQAARERLAREGLSADLRVGDFARLPWPDNCFDGVVENVSLYANPSAGIRQALQEVHRVLKPGALFLSSFFTEKTWGYGLGEMVEPDGYVNLREGPLAGKGFCLFLKRERIAEFFGRFSSIHIERISRTMDGEQHLVEQFVITCRKPESSGAFAYAEKHF